MIVAEAAAGPPGVPLMQVRNLVKHFRLPGGWLTGDRKIVHAVDDVSFDVWPGEVLGIVGESGSGKTTLGRLLLRLIEPTSGSVIFGGTPLGSLGDRELRQVRPQMQVVFQNPFASLSPRLTVHRVLTEPLLTHRVVSRTQIGDRVLELLERVGLGSQHLSRYPHELSGGQAQRVAIARALALRPKLLVLDEPTSALDVSVQAQILRMLEELRQREGLTYVFISHDLSVVHHVSDRIGVMYLGKLVELGPAGQVFTAPLHPYTRALLGALPRPDFVASRGLTVLEGTAPSPVSPPPGCRFHTRCPIAQPVCRADEPPLRDEGGGRQAACHLIGPPSRAAAPSPPQSASQSESISQSESPNQREKAC